jgi:AAA domain
MSAPPIATGGRAVNSAVAELAAIPRWVCWKAEQRNGKLAKVPYIAGGRRRASSTDPRTWNDFDTCWRSAFVDCAATGIGVVVDGSDDLMAADLDDCLVMPETNTLTVEAGTAIRRLNSYTEISPSGRGLRVFFRGTMADDGRKVAHLEIYRTKRYLTVTGAHFPGTPETINQVAPEIIAELLGPATKPNGEDRGEDLGDVGEVSDELRDRLEAAMAEDSALRAAWDGAPPDRDDQSRSAFDLKLAGALRRHGRFTLQDFATLARWWPYGKGADGDARHWRRTWERAAPSGPEKPDPEEEARRIAEQIKAQIISWPSLTGRQAPPRRFILPDWIPALCVTLLHGFGGVGKSLLAQMLGTTAILRCQFLGAVADACPVLAWWGEDDHDEIWRRQENINAALGIASLADLDGKLFWRPAPGDDLTLFTAANESDFRTTPLFNVLREQIADLKIPLAILDSATQIAAIPENNRPLVTRCLRPSRSSASRLRPPSC